MSQSNRHREFGQVLPWEEVHPREVHSLRSVGRPTRRSVGGRVSGPGDRALKTLSSGEPTSSFQAEGQGQHPKRVGVDACLSPGSKSSARSHQATAREPGDLDGALPDNVSGEPAQEGNQPQSGASVEKSDEVVVPEKSAKTWVTPVESMEGRAEAEGNSAAPDASSTQSEQGASPCSRSDTEGSLRSPLTQGGSPVREIRSPGSVRGAARKGRPYRDPQIGFAAPSGARRLQRLGSRACPTTRRENLRLDKEIGSS